MTAKKASKSQHYSGSESLAYRQFTSVAQRNVGHKYLLEVSNYKSTTCNIFVNFGGGGGKERINIFFVKNLL